MSELVRQAGEHDNISTLYVVDECGVFSGAIDLKDLIIAREGENRLEDIIRRSHPYVLTHEKVEDCIDRTQSMRRIRCRCWQRTEKLPVSSRRKGSGGAGRRCHGDDYAKLGGLTSEEEDLWEPTAVSMRKRLPAHCALFLGMGVSSVVGMFESVVSVCPLSFASPVPGAGHGG